MTIRYLSVCSGIEAATAAWHPLGWEPAAFAEIDAFPRAVIQHHYPAVPLHGDFTTIQANEYGTVDLLVGGTPCQSFSVAGLRGGLDDDRGNLALEFMRLAARVQPTWIVWENVPGVLSSNGGRDFGSILGALGELGYGWAYRVLDAQYFGVPQRRRRVFVVGCLGRWQRAAAVLFERHSVSGHPAPRREARQTAPTVPARRTGGGGLGTDFDCDGGLIARCDTTGEGRRFDSETTTLVAQDVRYAYYSHDYANDRITDPTGVNPALSARPTVSGNLNVLEPAVAFDAYNQACSHVTHTLRAGWGSASDDAIPRELVNAAVRRLTPRECERLQGFPDDYTLISWRNKPAEQCPDGPRYKALGNSMAVPVMRWIGERIAAVDALAET
jgi:DNA (cytosine-5)-methyltransferase 1